MTLRLRVAWSTDWPSQYTPCVLLTQCTRGAGSSLPFLKTYHLIFIHPPPQFLPLTSPSWVCPKHLTHFSNFFMSHLSLHQLPISFRPKCSLKMVSPRLWWADPLNPMVLWVFLLLNLLLHWLSSYLSDHSSRLVSLPYKGSLHPRNIGVLLVFL